MQTTIEKLVYGGDGLARTENGVIFVPRTVPGDIVEVCIAEQKKDYARGRLQKVIQPSEARKSPSCPNFETVGCCHWDHIRYERQLEYKTSILRESLARLARISYDGPIRTISGPERAYRLRAGFHLHQGELGFVRENTHVVVPITECAALAPELNAFISPASRIHLPASTVDVMSNGAETAATFRFDTGEENQPWEHWRDALFEIPGTNEVVFITPKRRLDYRKHKAIIEVHGNKYHYSAHTFFQANRFLLDEFIDAVVGETGPSPRNVLDLFSGSGFFSVPIARTCRQLIGVESDHQAVRQARLNATLNGLGNVEFAAGSVEGMLSASDLTPDVVILNPPRTGAGSKVVAQIASLKAPRVVYVSCNPTTFAPEAAVFQKSGYRLSSLVLLDQFPNTYHVELIARFELN